MSYKPPVGGSDMQNLFLELQTRMGGQFWPPELEEEDMPEVGAKYPMMLYDGDRECVVYDVEERAEAEKHGFRPHPSMERMAPDKPLVKPVVKTAPYLGQNGDVLECTMGNWTGEPDIYHYQFKRGSTLIGTDSNKYTVVAADAGHTVTCTVEAVNAAGSGSSTSNGIAIPVAKKAEPPKPTAKPVSSMSPSKKETR
jgi:hypothetical protein